MTMRNVAAVALTAWVGLSFLGCGAAPDSGKDDVVGPGGSETGAGESDLGEASDAIRFGIEGGGKGAVEIVDRDGRAGSGVIVGTGMILTASHSFDGSLANELFGDVLLKVNYALDGGKKWKCLTGAPATSNGKCAETRWVFVNRDTAHRPEKDYAVVFRAKTGGVNFSNIQPNETAWGLYDGPLGVGQAYVLWGAGYYHPDGTGAGVMRFMTDSVDWVGADHFITDATDTRVCRGDSGGPYFQQGSQWVFGLHSDSDKPSGGECAKVGGKQRGTRIASSKRGPINAWRVLRGLTECTPHSIQFPNHWVCP